MEWGCSPGRSRRGARCIGVRHLYPAGRGPCHCYRVLEVCPWGRCAPATGARQEGWFPEGPCTLRGDSLRSGARGPLRILDLLLDYTSVAASVVLVSTQPVFVAVLAYLLFGERTTRLSFLGIVVATAGTAVIALDRTVGSAA